MEYRIEGQRLYVDDNPVSLFSGSFQYWRIRPDLWSGILESVMGMGFDVIETYMPWSIHEISPGRFDFGSGRPELDLHGFLDLCTGTGLKVLARPGPHINAELTYFGYPERLFQMDEIMCRSADGSSVVLPAPPRMFPVPCYHHPRFQREVRIYFEALSEAVGDMLYPDGPIIAIQADNECSKFFRVHPFDHDYSEHSIRVYREFLQQKYASLRNLNHAWRSSFSDWDLVDPPRELEVGEPWQIPYYLDWIEFGEYYINQSLRAIAGMLRECFGDKVPLFHNYPTPMPVPPFDITKAEEFLDFQGIDSYPQKTQYHLIRRGIKYTSTMSRLPALLEFSSGGIYYAPPVSLEDQEFTTWATVMHGIKAINFYMIVERERWYGSPIKRDGTIRHRHYGFYRQFLEEVRAWGLEDMDLYRPVLFLLNRDYERLLAAATFPCPNSSLIDELIGSAEQAPDLLVADEYFGMGEPVAREYARLTAFWYWSLTAAGAHFAIGDSSADPGLLSRYKLVITPTLRFLDRGFAKRLLDYAAGGGTVVVGPYHPVFDEKMYPYEPMTEYLDNAAAVEPPTPPGLPEKPPRPGNVLPLKLAGIEGGSLLQVGLLPGPVCSAEEAKPFIKLVGALGEISGIAPAFVPEDSRTDVSLFTDRERSVLLVANPAPLEVETGFRHAGKGVLRDLRTGEKLGSAETAVISIEPFSIRALELE